MFIKYNVVALVFCFVFVASCNKEGTKGAANINTTSTSDLYFVATATRALDNAHAIDNTNINSLCIMDVKGGSNNVLFPFTPCTKDASNSHNSSNAVVFKSNKKVIVDDNINHCFYLYSPATKHINRSDISTHSGNGPNDNYTLIKNYTLDDNVTSNYDFLVGSNTITAYNFKALFTPATQNNAANPLSCNLYHTMSCIDIKASNANYSFVSIKVYATRVGQVYKAANLKIMSNATNEALSVKNSNPSANSDKVNGAYTPAFCTPVNADGNPLTAVTQADMVTITSDELKDNPITLNNTLQNCTPNNKFFIFPGSYYGYHPDAKNMPNDKPQAYIALLVEITDISDDYNPITILPKSWVCLPFYDSRTDTNYNANISGWQSGDIVRYPGVKYTYEIKFFANGALSVGITGPADSEYPDPWGRKPGDPVIAHTPFMLTVKQEAYFHVTDFNIDMPSSI